MIKKILVTGAAGFIGYHLCSRLIREGFDVHGIDNLNDYYDVSLKESRLKKLFKLTEESQMNFRFSKLDISILVDIEQLFKENNYDCVINLAAQAGVRYSLDNPHKYVDSNIVGFVNILECSRHSSIKHLIFASSSSVYGMNKNTPFSVNDNTEYPISLYAASKKSNELLAHSYSHLFQLPITGLRFFTVYGPFGRPDMAYFKFTKSILEGESIDVFNSGNMMRDFTYIDDIVEGIVRLIPKIPELITPENSSASSKFKIYNIGNNEAVKLSRFIEAIEKSTGCKAIINKLPMQPGDVPITYADIDDLKMAVNFQPKTSIEVGIKRFVDWYVNYKENQAEK